MNGLSCLLARRVIANRGRIVWRVPQIKKSPTGLYPFLRHNGDCVYGLNIPMAAANVQRGLWRVCAQRDVKIQRCPLIDGRAEQLSFRPLKDRSECDISETAGRTDRSSVYPHSGKEGFRAGPAS